MTKSVVISQQANHGHLCIPLIHFSSCYIGQKWGSTKSLENYLRIRRVCKGTTPLQAKLVKSTRTVSREFCLVKRVYIGFTSYG